MPTTEAFEDVVDPDVWVDVASIGGGFMGSLLAQVALDGVMPFDFPNEVYGIATAYVGYTVDVDQSDMVAVGGGLYALDQFSQRFDAKAKLVEAVM